MTYSEVTGDLFEQGLPAIGHGCNCAGSMSGGIALEFRKRYPAMHQEYVRRCSESTFSLGTFMPWEEPDVVIYNLATQSLSGPHADLEAIGASARAALADLEARGQPSLGLPRIGAGIGGLRWSDVAQTLRAVADESSVNVIVVRLP